MNCSRRKFIQLSTVTSAATAASLTPITSAFARAKEKSRVVIAKDPKCMNGTTPVTKKIQDMVDYSIMTLTNKQKKGEAYEALFPVVTKTTKIVLKRNDVSGKGSKSNKTTVECLQAGLQSMLNGTFPASNIKILNKQSNSASSKSMTCGGKSFKIAQIILDADYIINCPVAWCHGTGYAVTLAMKNTMNYIAKPRDFHSLDSTKCWLWECSLDPEIKKRQVLTVMDAIFGNHKSGPGSSATFEAHTLITSKDIVAVDYHAVEIMKEKGMSNSRVSTAQSQLQKAAQEGLGINDPNNMETIPIAPPWTTGIAHHNASSMSRQKIQIHQRGTNIEFLLPGTLKNKASLTVYAMNGKDIRTIHNTNSTRIVWDCCNTNHQPVAKGTYGYTIQAGQQSFQGTFSLNR